VDPSFRSDPKVFPVLRGPQDVFDGTGVNRPGESQRPGKTSCPQCPVEAFDARVQVRAAARQPALVVEDQDRPVVVALGDDANQTGLAVTLSAPDTGSHRLLARRRWRRGKNRRG
jgi:hypothetical protein